MSKTNSATVEMVKVNGGWQVVVLRTAPGFAPLYSSPVFPKRHAQVVAKEMAREYGVA